MGYTVRVEWEGLGEAVSRFSQMGEKLNNNLENQLQSLGRAGKDAWDSATPVRSGRLKGGNIAEASGLEVTFSNGVYYYKFRDIPGHMTPSYFHRHGRIVPAKRRSHVPGAPITKTLVEFLEGAVGEYLQKAVDDLGD